MENDTNDNISNLDGDVLLPPRKRLLAGMKRQNMNLPNPSAFLSCDGSEFESRMNSLLKSHLSNEEIVETSRLAAIEASKVAKAARAVAEEKAAKAAKAVAAARSALELVGAVNEETDNQEKYLKRNKMKKHVAIQSLYGKHNGIYSCNTDEELARKLHRVINSSPRILKSNACDPKSKKPKISSSSSSSKTGTSVATNVGTALEEGNQTSTNNGIADITDSDGCVVEKLMAEVDLNGNNRLKLLINTEKREAAKSSIKEMFAKDDDRGIDKKKVRIKQKTLPLSICNVRDLESPKEDLRAKYPSSSQDNRSKHAASGSKSLFSVGASGESVMQVESSATMWKCKGFKVPACVKQNKVMQS